MNKYRWKQRLMCGLMCLLLSACAAAPAESTPSKLPPLSDSSIADDSVVVVLPTESEPQAGLDPTYGWGVGEHMHEPLVQSTLVVTQDDFTVSNDLAQSVQSDQTAQVWTVRIRDDAVFSDGTPLTAHDVAFTYEHLKKNSTAADFTMLERAQAVDDTTVVFHMNRPYAVWPYLMAVTGILPAHSYGEGYGEQPIGSGRYQLVQWNRGQQMIFEANPHYYGDPPHIKRLVVLFMTEESALAAVNAGQADVVYTAPAYLDQSPKGYRMEALKSVDNRGLNLPATPFDGVSGNNLTADVRVRRAISLGLDRDAMARQVLSGAGSAAASVCDGMPWALSNVQAQYQPEAAAKLLDEAGWKAGASGIREKDGVRAELTLLYSAGDSARQALAAEAARQLEQLGIACSTEGVGWDTAYERALSDPMIWGWGAHTPMELYHLYHTDENGTARYSPYANSTVDTLMDRALAAPDLDESNRLWQQAQQEIDKDMPWVWLVNVDHLYWVREGLSITPQKVHPHGHGWSLVNNVHEWQRQAASAHKQAA